MALEAPNQIGLVEPLIVAVDNGATNTRIAVREGDQVLETLTYTTPYYYQTAINELGKNILDLSGKKPQAIGFAIAGEVDGISIVKAGQLQEYGWCERPFSEDVAAVIGIEPAAIVLMNDCVAAAKAQQVANRKVGAPDVGYIETISTGFGGAGFRGDELIADEPGHEFYKPGLRCGCGQDGCAEAYISGSGIRQRFQQSAERLEMHLWARVTADAAEIHFQMLERLKAKGLDPQTLYLFGSVALKSPVMLPDLRAELDGYVGVEEATHRDDSGLVGAGDAALELINQ